MNELFSRGILVSNEKRDYDYLEIPLVEDLIKGLGPIGGNIQDL
jgi:hypothetical protein